MSAEENDLSQSKPIRWTPLLGKCEEHDGILTFKGGILEVEGQPGPEVGNFIADRKFSGGTISTDFRFVEIDELTAGGIIFYHDTSIGFAVCSIGAGRLYSMFMLPKTGAWIRLTDVGDRKNIKANEIYMMIVEVEGSRVTLNVNGVDVCSHVMETPLPRGQVGIWCRSRSDIEIMNFKVKTSRPKAFVVMQLSSPYMEIYNDVIRRICHEFDIEVVKADDVYGPGIIIADIEKQIIESNFVICEITPANPNVYYELGFAHANRKPTILIADKNSVGDLPFDISPFRVLLYENSIAGKSRIENGLRKHLRAVLSKA